LSLDHCLRKPPGRKHTLGRPGFHNRSFGASPAKSAGQFHQAATVKSSYSLKSDRNQESIRVHVDLHGQGKDPNHQSVSDSRVSQNELPIEQNWSSANPALSIRCNPNHPSQSILESTTGALNAAVLAWPSFSLLNT
jgi:hypothetical protein